MVLLKPSVPTFLGRGKKRFALFLTAALGLASCGYYVDIDVCESFKLRAIAINAETGELNTVSAFEAADWRPGDSFFSIEGASAQASPSGCVSVVEYECWDSSDNKGSLNDPIYHFSKHGYAYFGFSLKDDGGLRYDLYEPELADAWQSLCGVAGATPGVYGKTESRATIHDKNGFQHFDLGASQENERLVGSLKTEHGFSVLTKSNTEHSLRLYLYDTEFSSSSELLLPEDMIFLGGNTTPASYFLELAGLNPTNGASILNGYNVDPSVSNPDLLAIGSLSGQARMTPILRLYETNSFLYLRSGKLQIADENGVVETLLETDLSAPPALIQFTDTNAILLVDNEILNPFSSGDPRYEATAGETTTLILLDENEDGVLSKKITVYYEENLVLGAFYYTNTIYLLVAEGAWKIITSQW